MIIKSVASLSRLWLQLAANSFVIKNHEIFRKVLRDRPGPLLTVSNHISTMDDPLIWGALLEAKEVEKLIYEGQMRWAVGAKELTFTNPFTSWFFGRGQVIPIVRGDGIYQPAMSEAIEILNTDRWLHYFPEGKVIQYKHQVSRLKWGVGRLLMEVQNDVTILPLFLKGLDLMKPNNLMPRFNHDLEIIIGDPVKSSDILKATEHIKDENERRSLITEYIQDLLNLTKTKQ
jgi:monolysocardiolipin acyltransferase